MDKQELQRKIDGYQEKIKIDEKTGLSALKMVVEKSRAKLEEVKRRRKEIEEQARERRRAGA